MGFFNNILSGFAINTQKGICKTMINSYNSVKKSNPDVPQKELYALAFSLRPSWKRENKSSYIFKRGSSNIIIEDSDTFRDLVRKIVLIETSPSGIGINQAYIMEVVAAVKDAFEGFTE